MLPRITSQGLAKFLLATCLASALFVGILAGYGLAATQNEINSENFEDFKPALPTKLLDIKGRLITEFSSDEKREMIGLDEVPHHLLQALVTREDQDFYRHKGYSLKGYTRAFLGILLHRSLGGGSTITQQLAGTLKADRDDKTIKRKLVELWWALQFERRFTKNEILELYINKMYFGDGYYGVESASKYFFGHSARELTPTESVVLVLQLSSVRLGRYNPFKNPAATKARSRAVLNEMVRADYISKAQADDSFTQYWDNFDYTRVPTQSFYNRDDKARYFSEYVRRQLDELLYGSIDYNKDGLIVHTTVNLDYQQAAETYVNQTIAQANKEFRAASSLRLREADATYVPIVNALTLMFDLNGLKSADARAKSKINSAYQNQINPIADVSALLFGIDGLKDITRHSYDKSKLDSQKTTVEGALICLDNDTGYILALIGGSGYSQSNQTIRAVQASVSPGSCFKPLYYSAAIDSRKFTEASLIYDEPIVFRKQDGSPYVPSNFKGKWEGPMLLWRALAKSMNIPSLRILDSIGFDAAIGRAASLMGITESETIAAVFPRVYPLGLGTLSTSPLQMARAFATFPNQGKEVSPIAIRSIEDRDGGIVLDVEKELRLQQKRKGQAIQLVSPQNAYIMTDLLSRVAREGTLMRQTDGGSFLTFRDQSGQKYTIPVAGKTGTTQNWADAWTVGFSPYVTTAVWFGFDSPGNSLGINQSGENLGGFTWARFMRDIHQGLKPRNFIKPQTGLVEVSVCADSGELPSDNCRNTVKLVFLEGTQPQTVCSLHTYGASTSEDAIESIRSSTERFQGQDQGGYSGDGGLVIDESLLGDKDSPSPRP